MIKVDRQFFRPLSGKFRAPKKALIYPLTTVPLALSKPDQTLRQQSTKAALRRRLYEKSVSIVRETLNETDWLVDGMAAVAIVPPQETYITILLKQFLVISNQKMLHGQKF